ncbi:MAG: alpha/beta hydrolase [Planctomycetaceae bacterium]|nr:alpha/beta hydrolase [Planctomycetaceae bacterium]
MNSIRWWLPPTTHAGPFNESGCKLRNLTRQRPTEPRCRCRVLNTVWVLIACLSSSVFGQQLDLKYQTEKDLPYYGEGQQTEYQKERCLLDVYYPMQDDDAALDRRPFPAVVWFHGGGLRGGSKSIPGRLKEQGVIVVAVNYRLFPKAKCPEYIQDAAAATAWAFKNVSRFGGDPKHIYVSGHSAGGYLTSMIGLDRTYLAAHDVDANQIAGLIPFSGHTITHFTPREEQGIPDVQPTIDRFAPLFHVRADAAPLVLITGDRELELLGRYEENAYMARMMHVVKHPSTRIYELGGFDHGGMADPAFTILLKFIRKTERDLSQTPQ